MKRRGWLQRRPLLGFCVLTFAWSWACWCLSAAVKLQSPWLSQVLMLAGGFGPSAAAVVVVWSTRGRAGLRAWFSRCMQWTVGWGWMALAFLAPLGVFSIAAGVHVVLGGSIVPSPASGQVPLAVINLFGVLLVGWPLGEESGWRGYATLVSTGQDGAIPLRQHHPGPEENWQADQASQGQAQQGGVSGGLSPAR